MKNLIGLNQNYRLFCFRKFNHFNLLIMVATNTTLQIRPIQKSDNETVAKVIREVMTEFGATSPGHSIGDHEVAHMFEAYNNDKSQYWVLTKDGIVVGCGGIAPLQGGDEDTCELRKMYFRTEARGHGMGKKMVQMCLEKAKELGYKKVYLETIPEMATANILYQKTGFKELSCRMGDTGHCACGAYYVKEVE